MAVSLTARTASSRVSIAAVLRHFGAVSSSGMDAIA